MKTKLALALFATAAMTLLANAQDYGVQFTPQEQTDSERLDSFQAPGPSKDTPSIVDRAIELYNSAPVRPAIIDGAPGLEFHESFE